MQNIKNIIITGSNKGIGYGIVQNLASKEGWNIIMACRNLQLAQKAKIQILNKSPNALINIQQLQIGNEDSVNKFIKVIQKKFKKIDILINNAGVFLRNGFNIEKNFFGTIFLSQKILQNINDNGKIIFIGSMKGKLSQIPSQHLKNKFRKQNLDKKQLFNLMNDFIQGVKEDNYTQRGWHKSMYGISKIGINYYPKVLANFQQVKKRNIQAYSCCPGYVNTDLSEHKGPLTIQQGALTPVFLAQLPFEVNQKYQGQFFQNQTLSSLQ